MSTSPFLTLQNIEKLYANEAGIKNLTLSIKQGEFVSILGPSGCGKSTLLRLIAGLSKPTKGSILFKGKDITHLPAQKRPFHTVFQNYALFPHMSVLEHLKFALRCQAFKGNYTEKIDEILNTVCLTQQAHQRPYALSGGQKQRLALARAIINKPQLLLLDECLNALDEQLRQSMQLELKKLQKTLGISFIFVTHSQREALSLSDSIVLLNRERVIQVGSPQDIYHRPNSIESAQMLGECNVFQLDYFNKNWVVNEQLYTNETADLTPGTFIVRPEHLSVSHTPNQFTTDSSCVLPGKVITSMYSGSSFMVQIKLQTGKVVLAKLPASYCLNHHLTLSENKSVFVSWSRHFESHLPKVN